MNIEREQQATEILLNEQAKTGNERHMIGKEEYGRYLKTSGISRDSQAVRDLEKAGFKVIFPAELTPERIEKLDVGQRTEYDLKKDSPLVIDMQEEEELSLDFADEVIAHYTSLGDRFSSPEYFGYTISDTESLSYMPTDLKEDSTKKLIDILKEIGFEAEFSDDNRGGIHVTAAQPAKPSVIVPEGAYADWHGEVGDKLADTFKELKDMQRSPDRGTKISEAPTIE